MEGGEKENEASAGIHEPLLLKEPRKPSLQQRLSRSVSTNTTSQLAIVGSNVCPIESLDYEIVENDLFKHDWRSRTRIQIFQYIVLKWTLAFLIGLFTGLVGFIINLAVENIAGAKLVITNNFMIEERYAMAFAVFAGSNLVLVTFAAVVCAYIAPAAAGSGIPEVKAYLNGIDAPGILSPVTLIVKILGSIGAVSGSLDVGKEGPLVHTGACIASLLGQGGSKRYHLTWKWLRYFKNDRDRRDLITCGSAAGVAAAFRAPVGGVLFALEEVSSWWRSALLWRTFFTAAVVAVVLRALKDFCETGKCGLFGKGGLIMFDVSSVKISYHADDLLPVVILGVIGGLLGSLFNYLLDKILRIYSLINERGPVFKLILACTMSIVTSSCCFGLPWLAQCTPCPKGITEECPTVARSGNYKQFQCPDGYYNDLASLVFNTNDDAIRNLFSSGNPNVFRHSSVLMFFGTMYILGLFTYGISVPGGLFIPIIVTGATYGRFVGMLMGLSSNLNQGLFAVLGAASFLGGSMRMTVSLCIILLELTNNLLMLPLVMLVLLISKTVADAFNSGVYDQIVHMKGLPYLEAHAEPYMRQLTAGDVVTGPLVTFSGIEKVGTIFFYLKNTNHNGFPVIDEPPISEAPVLCGLVLRSHLLVLLKRKEFLPSRTSYSGDPSQRFTSVDFAKPGSGKGFKLEQIELSAEEMEMYVDLHPFTNTSPYTVVETMSLAKALLLFRQLGLRHLCVVPKSCDRSPIVGILTRHDFMPEHVLGLHPDLKESKWKRLRLRPSMLNSVVRRPSSTQCLDL
uniref:Chloride channel protein n=1 Tax=Araucaria cunninghamii TaxID=56994 RepID=A0A0D6QZK5_ARACU